jgi:Fe-S-cluster containining protein
MGEAKRRKAEIEGLKRFGPRIDPTSSDPEPAAVMARRLYSMFEAAKQDGNIDPPVNFIHSKLDTTIQGFGQLPIACKKGCSHCCYIWVSATAPELLFIAKIIRDRGGQVIEQLRRAHLHTMEFNFDARAEHPHPCPLLEQDVCSIYDSRPKACRLAASADASVCARSYHNVTDEDIPTPALHLMGRTVYAIALAVALKRSNLPYDAYELNSGLVRALDVPDAERAWLNGNDIFADVMHDPAADIFAERPTQMLFKHAFG